MIKRNILLNPGPATTTDTVKMAQVVPDICPREKEFCGIIKSIRKDLVKIVNGDENYTSILFTGSGTSVMDAVMNSVIVPNKKVLIINNGAYCERLKEICDVYKIDNIELNFGAGNEIDISKLKEFMKKNKIDYIATVHHETTTGIINPIEEVGRIAKENNCIFIVDTVSSFAGVHIDIKKCNIDFMISTSNKNIQGMAGCAFVICKKFELEKTKNFRRSFYLNLWSQYDYFEKTGQMQFTPPVQIIYAMRKAIDELFDEGLENRFKRYKKNHETLVKGLKELGFEIGGGVLLTTVREPEGFDFEKIHDELYKRGFTIYPGKVIDKKTFRIANIGAIDYKDIKNFLKAFKEILNIASYI